MPRSSRQLFGEPLGAWVTLAGGVIAVCAHSASSYPIPVMMKSILAEMHWGRAEFAATAITRSAAVAVSGLAWGIATDRVGARAVLVTGAFLAAAAQLLFGAMHSLAELYVIGAITGTGIGALGPVATSTLVTRRFGPQRGLALGLLHGGDNLLNSVIPRATAAAMVAWGWRWASWTVAAAYVVVAGIIVATIPAGEGRSEERAEPRRSLDLRALPWRHSELYLVAAVLLVGYAFLGAVMFHLVPYQTDLGIPVEEATTTFGILIFAGFFGSLGAGLLAERTSAVTTLLVVQTLVATCSLALWRSPDAAQLRWWAWLHGLGAAGYAPLTALVMAQLFGSRAPNLGALIGLAFVVAMTGVYLGNLGSGWGHDLTGTYAPGWQIASVLLVASLVPLAALRRRVVADSAPH